MLVSGDEDHDRLGISSSHGQGDLWKRLWSLKVVPKVRVFWWRVMRGIVTDYSTLTRRHVRDNNTCSVCKSASETLLHALAECPHACLFWTGARDILNIKLPRLHPDTWAADVLCESWWSQDERAKVITVMWSIWSSGNRWAHGEKGYDPSVAIKSVHDTLLELELPPKDDGPLKNVGKKCTWQRPSNGVIKLNIDGAINAQDTIAGSGGVARDAAGVFLGAWCNAYPGIVGPLISEALALQDAVLFARAHNLSQVKLRLIARS